MAWKSFADVLLHVTELDEVVWAGHKLTFTVAVGKSQYRGSTPILKVQKTAGGPWLEVAHAEQLALLLAGQEWKRMKQRGESTEGGIKAERVQTISEREAKAIRAAISVGESIDAWTEAIHALDGAFGAASSKSREMLANLVRRKLLTLRTQAGNVVQAYKTWWELGAKHPDASKP
jgi:hypothetical protein